MSYMRPRYQVRVYRTIGPLVSLFEPRHKKICFLHMGNKGTDQLSRNSAADQRLCFRYIDSSIPVLLKSKISSL